MKQYSTILACALLFFSASVFAQSEIPASDSRITFVGRTEVSDGGVSFDWSATYARISFSGSRLSMKASDTKKNYYDVWIDSETDATPDKVVTTGTETEEIVLCTSEDLLKKYGKAARKIKSHNVIIKKRTEGEQGLTTIYSFATDGTFLQAEGLKERMIEFVGDSYTCGYGTESDCKSDPFLPETENSNLTYAAIVSRYFDADYISISHSGRGIARNYGDHQSGLMPDKYLMTFDDESRTSSWDAANENFKPQLTVIYLCTNDFSTEKQPNYRWFKEKYIQLINEAKANYGENHPVLCVASKADPLCADYVRNVVEQCGKTNVFFTCFTEGVHGYDGELGASWHPNYRGQLKKAYVLIPYISTICAWPLEDKVVK